MIALGNFVPEVTARAINAVEPTTFNAPRGAVALLGGLFLLGALMTITRRNPVSAVMWLVGTFFGLAGTYALLFAHFLAALQVLVYAGAIMVLFIFVVMVLNRDEVEPYTFKSVLIRVPIVGVALAFLVWQFYKQTRDLVPTHPADPPAEFGTVAQVGTILFTDYLFVFEAVSVLLLVAVVAAVVVARAHRPEAGGAMEGDILDSELANEPGHGLAGPASIPHPGHGDHEHDHGHDDHGHGAGGHDQGAH